MAIATVELSLASFGYGPTENDGIERVNTGVFFVFRVTPTPGYWGRDPEALRDIYFLSVRPVL